MKNFLNEFVEFITGGFFNYIGAAARKPFSKSSFSALLNESLSNYAGMMVTAVILFLAILLVKLSL